MVRCDHDARNLLQLTAWAAGRQELGTVHHIALVHMPGSTLGLGLHRCCCVRTAVLPCRAAAWPGAVSCVGDVTAMRVWPCCAEVTEPAGGSNGVWVTGPYDQAEVCFSSLKR